jgi:two-component system OmpR family response regulator
MFALPSKADTRQGSGFAKALPGWRTVAAHYFQRCKLALGIHLLNLICSLGRPTYDLLTRLDAWVIWFFAICLLRVFSRPQHNETLWKQAAFLLPRWRVASCCEDGVRNISKLKSFVGSPERGKGVRMATASPSILVVEDDRETRTLIAKYLRTNACNVTTANDGREMVRAMTDHRVDLLILDVMLPGEDGLSLCRKVRAESQMPIIMLTARGEDVDRILGLEMGADDYLAKPFNPRELLARINAVLRRQAAGQTASATSSATALTFLGWQIDFRLRELRNPAGARVAMTSAEFDLLRTFCERPGRVLSRDSLLDLTQGRNAGSFERSIDVLVSRIRRKIDPDPLEPTMIKTVRSGGYMFTPTVDTVTPPANGRS